MKDYDHASDYKPEGKEWEGKIRREERALSFL